MSASLPPISSDERRQRVLRIRRLARRLGFTGVVEYRHVLSNTGGAQYGMGSSADEDLLVVFAEAFERDANPADFSLEAIVAHERGHQLLLRHPRLRRISSSQRISLVSEEILASLIGSLIAERERDRADLYTKALYDAVDQGLAAEAAVPLLHELRRLLEQAL